MCVCGRCWSSPDTRFGGKPVEPSEKSDKMKSVSPVLEKRLYSVRSLESWMAFLKYARMFAPFLARGVVFYSKQNFRAKIPIKGAGIELPPRA